MDDGDSGTRWMAFRDRGPSAAAIGAVAMIYEEAGMGIARMDPDKIGYVTLHCTATPEGRNNSADEVRAWDIERFGQPSYHWVIELDGEAVRHLGDDQRGAHTANHNTGNIGIAYVGGTATLNAGAKPKDTRTDAQRATMKRLIAEYLSKHPGLIVRGHRDWPGVAKACPSFDVAAWLKAEGLA